MGVFIWSQRFYVSDEYGLKVENEFGMVREYCTRDSMELVCYLEKDINATRDNMTQISISSKKTS
eukprot:UN09546